MRIGLQCRWMPQTSVSEDRSRQPCEKHVDSVYGEGFSVIGYGNFTIGLVKVGQRFSTDTWLILRELRGSRYYRCLQSRMTRVERPRVRFQLAFRFSNPCTISSWKCLTGFEGPWSLIAVEDKAPFHISGQSIIFKKNGA